MPSTMRRPTGLPEGDAESGPAPASGGSAREVGAVDVGAARASSRLLGSVGSMPPLEHGRRKGAKGSTGSGQTAAKKRIKRIFMDIRKCAYVRGKIME